MASFRSQANALLRKSATYQKRNIGTNCCLLTAPIIFSLLLLIIQMLINNVFLAGDDFKCGCQCTSCCWNNNPNNCTQIDSGVCDPAGNGKFTCQVYNTSNCGPQFSSGQQSGFCSIPYPSNWPPLIDTPKPKWRTWKDRPATTILTTAVTQSSAVALGNLLVNQLESFLVAPGDLAQLKKLLVGNSTLGIPGVYAPAPPNSTVAGGTFNGYILSEMGLQFGSSVTPEQSYYVPSAFLSTSGTYVLLPNSTCEAIGLSQTAPVTFSKFLLTYGNITSGGLNTSTGNLFDLGSFHVVCTDAVIRPQPNASAIDNTLYCGYRQSRCNGTSATQQYTGAWDFQDTTLSKFNVNAYYNQTDRAGMDNQPSDNLQVPSLVNMAAKAWYRQYIDNSSVVPPTTLLGVMSMPKAASKLKLDFSSLLGPLFYTWVVQLLFPTFLQQLVYEKEKRLRMMMKMHGLGDGAYWAITYAWYLLLYCLYIIVFMVFGYAVGLKYFRKTSIGIQIVFYFLHGQCMIAFAFLLSSLFTSALTAVVFAYLYVFASGLIGSLLLQTFMNDDAFWMFFVEWVPAWSLFRGLYEMGTYAFFGVYTDQPGLQWSNLSDPGCGMAATWGIFAVEWALFMVLGWYLEQVLSSGTGIRRHPLFFLEWCTGKKRSTAHHARVADTTTDSASTSTDLAIAVKGEVTELADVRAEAERVEALTDLSDVPIVMKHLQKTYPGLDGGKPKTAVRDLTLGIKRGECFGLLGPNGAGKTTTLNMLTGFLEASSGSAVVEGHDINTEMQKVYKLMGVCPQHDLLWEQLTGEEHLLFYGRLKGMTRQELGPAITTALQSVNLLNVRDKKSGQYSGGMKRRLSVAISFMGQPKVVYLDEPSTGLDPASRRGLWQVVKSNKAGRALILTTHSMEEAEILCDRLGIFVDGQLVCVGNPKEITSRYAGYLVFTITVPAGQEEGARQLVMGMSRNAVLTYELGGTLKYELPTSDISLSAVFETVDGAKNRGMVVVDWGVANATLEEVFIKFAKDTNITSHG